MSKTDLLSYEENLLMYEDENYRLSQFGETSELSQEEIESNEE